MHKLSEDDRGIKNSISARSLKILTLRVKYKKEDYL